LRTKKSPSSSPATQKKEKNANKKDAIEEKNKNSATDPLNDVSTKEITPSSTLTKNEEQKAKPLAREDQSKEEQQQSPPQEVEKELIIPPAKETSSEPEPIKTEVSKGGEVQRGKRAKFERRFVEADIPSSQERVATPTTTTTATTEPEKISQIPIAPPSPVSVNPISEKTELEQGERKLEQQPIQKEEEGWHVEKEGSEPLEKSLESQPIQEMQPIPSSSTPPPAALDPLSSLSSSSPSSMLSTVTVQELPEVQEFKVDVTEQKDKKKGKKKKKLKKVRKPKRDEEEEEEEEEEENAFPKKVKIKKEKIAFSDRVIRFALKYTRVPTRIIAKRMPGLRDNLLRSNMRISPEGVISLALLFTFISIPISIFGAYELWNFGLRPWALFVPAVCVVPFFIGITMPKVSASSRAQALDNELPYLIAYITVLAGGGISPIVTLKRISKAAKIFPAAAKEAARILMDIEIFGLDAISALERETRLTPNKTFSEFIGGYVAVLKTGGDALSYLEAKLKEIFSVRESKVKSGSEFIATMSEAYIITTVVMGVSLMVLWATQNLMSPTGLPTTGGSVNSTLIVMFSGLFVPVISLIFIIVIGSSQIKEPFTYDMPFYIFLACMPVGALIYFLPLGLPIYYQLGIGLLVASGPPMIFQMMYKKRKEAVEAKLSNFLRDLSEVRKTGLSPEKTIEQLANRNYGALTVHVKKIAAQVSWGTPLKTVLQTFIKEVKSWVSRAVAFLLLEVVDVGGGSAKMFISLADFTERNAQLDKERKSQIRPYIIIPYIGAILIVATTAMMVYYAGFSFQSFPGASSFTANFTPSTSVLTEATNTLLLAAFFQAWVMGFVAGKMGEGSAADGFKHATLLITISMVTVIVTSLFIKI
jgi:flagellar protein FlaJ